MALTGHVDEISRQKVVGWAADKDRPGASVEIIVLLDGVECGRVACMRPRERMEKLFPGSTGLYGFEFTFKPELSVFRQHRVEVRYAATGNLLPKGEENFSAPQRGNTPLLPIIVTSTGRSGTTVLMSKLAGHPRIVVANQYPYEIKLAAYYAAAYRTLIAGADRERSTHPETMFAAKNQFSIGFNPFNKPGIHGVATRAKSVREFFDQTVPSALASAFRDLLLTYYNILKQDQAKASARFFAEKSELDEVARLGPRIFFGEVREIVLVRDPRDLLCSSKAFWKLNSEQALQTLKNTTSRLVEIRARADQDTIFVRYEDLIERPGETWDEIYRFIGVENLSQADVKHEEVLFKRHGTSADPLASVGRWVTDLSAAEKASCQDAFGKFMECFGYEVPVRAHPTELHPPPGAGVTEGVKNAPPRNAHSPQYPPTTRSSADDASGAEVEAALKSRDHYLLDLGQDEIILTSGPAASAGSSLRVERRPDGSGVAEKNSGMNENGELAIEFSAGGNSADYRRGGWSNAELRHTWTIGTDSALELPRPGAPGTYTLSVKLAPYLWKEKLQAQRLVVTVNGSEVGSYVVRKATVLECQLPWALIADKDIIAVVFHHPDAAKPNEVSGVPDQRIIALAFETLFLARANEPQPVSPPAPPVLPVPPARSTLSAAATAAKDKFGDAGAYHDLMLEFESLGENCEFGLVQRRCGAEPLGLLRFSSTPLPSLVAALDNNFANLGQAENLEVEVSANGREYMVREKKYHLLYHPWVLTGEATAEEVHQREVKRLPYLTRKLVEDLNEARKIFIYRGMSPLPEADLRRLLAALRRYGPNALLWVELHDAAHQAGTVEEIGEGLLKGYIDRFAPGENAHDLSLPVWIAICQNAHRLHQAERAARSRVAG